MGDSDGRPATYYTIVGTSRTVTVHRHAEAFADRFGQPVRKAAFFAAREGPRATLRKYRSKMIEKRVEEGLVGLIVRAATEGTTLFGFTRLLGDLPSVERALIFCADPDVRLDDIVLGDAASELLEAYLPVPECPLARELSQAVLRDNPRLRPASADDVRAGVAAALLRVEDAAERQGDPQGDRQGDRHGRPRSGRDDRGSEVYLFGLGGYARDTVLPRFGDQVVAAVDYRAALLRRQASWPFPVDATADRALAQIADAVRPLVIIASYHSSHAPLAAAALTANPQARVFVEKPPAVSTADAATLTGLREQGCWIDVGYNRRYAPMSDRLRSIARQRQGPATLAISVKEVAVHRGHWYHWPGQGGRVTGNLCHWIDLAWDLVGSPVEDVAVAGSDERMAVTLAFADGSIASLVAATDGDALRGVQERIEFRGNGVVAVIDDYTRFELTRRGRRQVWRRLQRDKGHDAMYRDLRERWTAGGPPSYPVGDLVAVQSLVETVAGRLDGPSNRAAEPSRTAAGRPEGQTS
jgi:predicted dehydrogenase